MRNEEATNKSSGEQNPLLRLLILTSWMLTLLLQGCSTDGGTHSTAPGAAVGFAEFYAYKGRTLGYPIAIYEMKAGQPVLLGKCGNFRALDSRKRFNLPPGDHEFLLVHAQAQHPLRLRLEPGMITPVRMTITKLDSEPVTVWEWRVRYRFEINPEPAMPWK